jgi:hypothetical protein
MNTILEKIKTAQSLFREKLETIQKSGGISKEQYVRFLTMQYHLTKGVQKPFYQIAQQSPIGRKKGLRSWLIGFAQEEEFHFEIAKADLKELGQIPGEMPLDTYLWWKYFDSIIETKPFIRLGATCILENISDGSADVLDALIKKSDFLNPKNLRFLIIHRHGPNLAHGQAIVQALSEADLNAEEIADVIHGCEVATVLYLRMAHWIVTGENLK